MRVNTYPLLMAGLLLLLAATPAAAQDRIPWKTSVEQAQQVAAEQQRVVLLHFYGDNCPPCRQLERRVFNRPEVIRSINVSYVPVKINVSDQQRLAGKYGVSRIPTDVFVLPDGTELFREISQQDPLKYQMRLDEIAAKSRVALHPTIEAWAQTTPEPSVEVAQQPVAPARYGNSAYQPPDWAQRSGYAPTPGHISAPQHQFGYQQPAGPDHSAQRTAVPDVQRRENPFYDPAQTTTLDAAAPRQPESRYGYAAGNPAPIERPHQDTIAPAEVVNRYSMGTAPGYGAPTQHGLAATDLPPENMGASRYGATPSLGAPIYQNPAAPDHMQYSASNNRWREDAAVQPPPAAPYGAAPPNVETTSNHDHPVAGQRPLASSPDIAPVTPVQDPQVANPPMALDGYCAVTLVNDKKWKKADPRWGAIHKERTYLFAGWAEQQLFLANPDKYSPGLSGHDPVLFSEQGQWVSGKRDFGLFVGDQFYLFADVATMERFEANPEMYSERVQQALNAPPGGPLRR